MTTTAPTGSAFPSHLVLSWAPVDTAFTPETPWPVKQTHACGRSVLVKREKPPTTTITRRIFYHIQHPTQIQQHEGVWNQSLVIIATTSSHLKARREVCGALMPGLRGLPVVTQVLVGSYTVRVLSGFRTCFCLNTHPVWGSACISVQIYTPIRGPACHCVQKLHPLRGSTCVSVQICTPIRGPACHLHRFRLCRM